MRGGRDRTASAEGLVWPHFLTTGGIGLAVLAVALLRFRAAAARAVS